MTDPSDLHNSSLPFNISFLQLAQSVLERLTRKADLQLFQKHSYKPDQYDEHTLGFRCWISLLVGKIKRLQTLSPREHCGNAPSYTDNCMWWNRFWTLKLRAERCEEILGGHVCDVFMSPCGGMLVCVYVCECLCDDCCLWVRWGDCNDPRVTSRFTTTPFVRRLSG